VKDERNQNPEESVTVDFSAEDWAWITKCAAADGQDPEEWVLEKTRLGLLNVHSTGKLHGKN
jgi:heme/copper-type cytochrome/quinol oxidase subunit 2